MENKDLIILVVDDEPDLRDFVGDVVKSLGFQPALAKDGVEGLDIIKKHHSKIALVVCDYKMPNMTGFELREKMLEQWSMVPFILLSAFVSREDALQGIDLKISAFLEKPKGLGDLKSSIEKESKERIASLKEEAELLTGFIAEAEVNIEQAETLVFELESHPQDLELLNRIFGLVHTLKGASGFFTPLTLHQFVHKFEDLLSQLKAGKLTVSSEIISVILQSMSIITTLVGELKSGEHVTTDLNALLAVLNFNQRNVANVPSSGAVAATKVATAAEGNKDLRVSVELLDEFMQISGEMTVLRNMIDKRLRSLEAAVPGNKDVDLLLELFDEVHKINASIQSKIVEVRKTPVRNIIKSFPRIIRELGSKLNKEVELQSVGDDLLVDTAVADVLSKSLIHMIRNSIDHGLELPEQRLAKGKARKGNICISSSLKDDNILVEISDDGAGIQSSKIKEKLLKNGMSAETIEQMSEEKILMQLFEPGFSTATVVTEVSGRGVGMDMVKKSVEGLKGEVTIRTEIGKGTSFRIKIPAPRSVHIMNSLIVSLANQRFCIPQDNVVRLLEISKEQRNQFIADLQGARMLRLDAELVPLIDFRKCLQLAETEFRDERKIIILKNSNDSKLAIVVDEILDIEDTVAKPLPEFIRKYKIFSGATFMGDGQVGLILSVDGIAESANVNVHNTVVKENKQYKKNQKEESLILFELQNGKGLFAISQSEISRLEIWQKKDIQYSGSRWVVPYRGSILSLYDLASLLEIPVPLDALNKSQEKDATYLSLIFEDKENNSKTGLMVKAVVDIVKTENSLIEDIKERGVRGTLILPNQTVTVVNVKELLAA